jgi:hypothetical protein
MAALENEGYEGSSPTGKIGVWAPGNAEVNYRIIRIV